MKKKHIILGLVSAALLLSLFTFLILRDSSKTPNNTSANTTTQPGEISSNEINSQSNESNDKVSVIEKNSPANNPTVPGESKLQINPVIVYAGVFGDMLEISAYAPITEAGGNCTATITNVASNETNTITGKANPSAKTTDCELLTIPTSNIESGAYNVTVSYASANYEGVSDIVMVEIP